MSTIKVWKDSGALLFDTDKITYGLVKSGYMAFQQGWTRRELRSIQLDPNQGGNWFPSQVSGSTDLGDGLWGFTVYNANSPIVFIVGSGCLSGTSVVGNATTFFYSNAGVGTKYYCFDLMSDNIAGSPFLKTWDSSGRITFNSLQPVLNVITTVQAPVPGALDRFGRYITTYAGGANRVRQVESPTNRGQVDSYVDIAIGAEEYAAHLPWSRSVGYMDFMTSGGFIQYSGVEGVYGRVGGISFMFGSAPAQPQARPSSVGWALPISFYNLPTDRYPVALVIKTATLPFPFG
jgi:hypothetical protein